MSKKIAVLIGVLFGCLLVVELVPLKTIAYTVKVDYQDTETYYEDEPYEETETYIETVPLEYEVVESAAYFEGVTIVASIVVRNKDNIAGTFTVDLSVIYDCTFISPGSIIVGPELVSDEKELHLAPNGKGTAIFSVDNEYPANCGFKSWSYDVTPDTKEVEKERTVTKYRQVEKQRTVTKQREETRYKKITLLDYWLHYQFP